MIDDLESSIEVTAENGVTLVGLLDLHLKGMALLERIGFNLVF